MNERVQITALFCAKASSAAYGDLSRMRYISSVNGSIKEFDHSIHGAYAQVSFGGFGALIAFRGTNVTEVTDLIADVSILPSISGFHSGFSAYVDFLLSDIEGWLDNVLTTNPRAHVTITGHSMGGAMAQIYAFRFVEKYHRLPLVFAFDSPACMTSSKAAQFDRTFTQSWRVYIHGDPIVKILNWVFQHTARMAEISSDGRIQYEPSGIFDVGTSHSIETLISYLEQSLRTCFFNFLLLTNS